MSPMFLLLVSSPQARLLGMGFLPGVVEEGHYRLLLRRILLGIQHRHLKLHCLGRTIEAPLYSFA